MKNPLRKRFFRELREEIGKYLVVFILMTATIGFVSGFLVADGSMLTAYNNSFQKYNIEDGKFETEEKIYKNQQEDIEGYGVKLYENFYVEKVLLNGTTLRIFKNRTKVDKVCLMKGKLPEKTGEIAIDRMYADNNKLSVGKPIFFRYAKCNHKAVLILHNLILAKFCDPTSRHNHRYTAMHSGYKI